MEAMDIFLTDIIAGIFFIISLLLIFMSIMIYRNNHRMYPISIKVTGIILFLGSLYWILAVLLDQPREFYCSLIIWLVGVISLIVSFVLWRSGK